MSAQTPFLVFSGTNSRYLAEKICNSLGCPLGQMNIQHFADGEFSVSYLFRMKNLSVAVMYFWYNQRFPMPTT